MSLGTCIRSTYGFLGDNRVDKGGDEPASLRVVMRRLGRLREVQEIALPPALAETTDERLSSRQTVLFAPSSRVTTFPKGV